MVIKFSNAKINRPWLFRKYNLATFIADICKNKLYN